MTTTSLKERIDLLIVLIKKSIEVYVTKENRWVGIVNMMIEGNEKNMRERKRVMMIEHLDSQKIVMMGGDKLYLHYLLPMHQFSLKYAC